MEIWTGRSSTEVLDGDLHNEQEKSCCNSSPPDAREREREREEVVAVRSHWKTTT
jgi:hypothetical protein